MKTVKQAEKIIHKACKEAKAAGYYITSSYRIIRSDNLFEGLCIKRCCPLGACDINGKTSNFHTAARKILGWNKSRANAFAIGFDYGADETVKFSHPLITRDLRKYPQEFKLGYKFRPEMD